jgi:Hsp90 protein
LKGAATATSLDPHSTTNPEGLMGDVADEFCLWFQNTLGHDKVEACTPTCEFASQPARVIHDDENPNEVKHLEAMSSVEQAKKHVEINPQHPLIVEIHKARELHPCLAQLLAAQVYDNCLINAGLLHDFRMMVTRVNDFSLMLLQEKNKTPTTPTTVATAVQDTVASNNIDKNSADSTSTEATEFSEDEPAQAVPKTVDSDDKTNNEDDDEDDATVYSDDERSVASDSDGSLG